MGSRSSKEVGASSSLRSVRKTGVFHSSCLGESSGSTSDDDCVSDPQNNAELESEACTGIERKKPTTRKREFCAKVRFLHHNQIPSTTTNEDLNDWGQESNTHTESGVESSSTQTAVPQSSNRLFRSRSRFNFIPDNISLRFSRTGSLRSLRPCSLVSTNASVSNPEEVFHVNMRSSSSVRSVHPPTQFHDPSGQLEPSAASLPVHIQDRGIVSLAEMARDNTNATVGPAVNRYSQTNNTEIENTETRQTDRRVRAQDNVDGSIRFSRALSVGRLRDRVLCRTFSEGIFGHVSEAREAVDTRQASERLIWSSTRESSDGNAEMLPTSSSHQITSSSSQENGRQDYEVDPPNMREVRNHALVEHRTAFLERRRRIRSQVRALQRLGRRFESLSGHDRSCILSGQHRSGHCMCRASGLAPNPDEETGTRARISRIVMLAEALFEVLDEIHQQSVVLSSRPSMSCIGSVPAPKEVVDCMPVKIYRKPQKHQNGEVAQCYICLNEYEEGDCNRILPCHHEFHQLCIDKWLKEIHRVCPLCRGDVCRTDLSS